MVYAIDLSNTTANPIAKFSSFASIVNLILPLLTIVAATAALLMGIIGALQILTAGGSSEKRQKAQKTFIFAVAGLILVIASYLIVKVIGKIFGIENVLPL